MKNEDFLNSLNDIDSSYFEEAISEEEASRIRKKNIGFKVLRLSSVAAAAVILLLSVVFLLPKTSNVVVNDVVEITALTEGNGGIAVETGFKICFSSSTAAYTESDIENAVKIEPEISFTVTKENENSFIIQPDEALKRNTVYSFSFAGKTSFSWAFQTEGDYTVVKTVPSDGMEIAPVNAGIEITFSQLCAASNWEEYFEISPQVEGAFELHGKTLVFVPSKNLSYNTEYKVTVKAGLTNDAGSSLKEPYSFSFMTKQFTKKSIYLINEYNETYLPSDSIIIAVSIDKAYKTSAFSANVYKLADQNEYFSLAKTGRVSKFSSQLSNLVDTSGRVSFMQTELLPVVCESEYEGFDSFVLPEKLPVGYYLVDIRNENAGSVQKLVQVSDISVHIQSVNGQTLVWANDSSSGAACENAKIDLLAGSSSASATTDKDGVAIVDFNPPDDEISQLCITYGEKSYAEFLQLAACEATPVKDYYFYVYTDREVYMPNDTVHYWGVLLPRRAGVSLPKSVTLCVDGEADAEVEINGDGSFCGQLSFKSNQTAYYPLSFYIGDVIIGEYVVSVSDYVKPVYKFSAEFDKQYYKRGEQISAVLFGSYYDGASAAGATIVDSKKSSVVLDEQGKGIFNYIAQAEPYKSWKPISFSKTFSVGGTDENQSAGDCEATIYPSDIMLEAKGVSSAEYKQLEIRTHMLNFDNVGSAEYIAAENLGYDEGGEEKKLDLLRGNTVDISGTIVIKKMVTIKTLKGYAYDYILKQRVEEYSYSTEERFVEEIPFSTQNGLFVSEKLGYQNTENERYYCEINYKATDGFELMESVYFDTSYYEDGRGRFFRYGFNGADSFPSFSEKKPAALELINLLTGKVPTGGQLLYTAVQDRILSSSVVQNGKAEVSFDEKLLPDFSVCGAYFDGKHIYNVETQRFYYDRTERELLVSASADKSSYRPGEEVTLSVKVSDKDGNGISAMTVVSVVDEAAFAVGSQAANPLATLYKGIYNVSPCPHWPYVFNNLTTSDNYSAPNNYVMVFSSYVDYDIYVTDGGMGSETGQLRCDFVDTPAFIPVTTDSAGNATVTFTLPDNITQWRATVVAVGDKPSAGHTKINFTSSLPFYVQPVYDKNLCVTDDFSIALRGVGTSLSGGEDVTYNVYLDGIAKEAAGKAETASFVQFGKLIAGVHTVRIEAFCNGLSDIVEVPVTVSESRLEIPLCETLDLKDGINISAVKYPVRLMVYDKKYDLYMRALAYLSRQYGADGAKQLAGVFALAKQKELNGETFDEPVLDIPGVSSVYWAEPDSILTAKAMISMENYMETSASKKTLTNILLNYKSSADEVCAAYLGLAALREPVLLDIRSLIGSDKLSFDNKLTLATALALLGDYSSASAWYEAKLLPLIANEDGKASVNSNYEQTANALVLAACLKAADFEKMLEYVIVTKSDEYLAVLDVMGALCCMQQPGSSESSFSYNLGGETITADFSQKYVYEFAFDEDMLKTAAFKQLSGKIGVKSSYTGGIEALGEAQSDKMSITKKADKYSVKVGDRIKITQKIGVEFTEENEIFAISDVLPAGTRFDGVCGNRFMQVVSEENGKVQIILYNTRKDSHSSAGREFVVSYYVRAILPGETQLSAPVLMGSVVSGFATSEAEKITIKP